LLRRTRLDYFLGGFLELDLPLLQFDQVVLKGLPGRSRLQLAPPLEFTLDSGEWLGIQGSSLPASTVLRLCNRLAKPLKGSIYFKDRSVEEWSAVALRRQAVLVAGEPDFLGLSVQETLCYPLQLQGIDRSRCIHQLEKICEDWQIPTRLYDDREYQLSIPDRQRIVLARAMMLQPELLLLDLDIQSLSMLQETIVPPLDRLVKEENLSILTTIVSPDFRLPAGSRTVELSSLDIPPSPSTDLEEEEVW
jgi:D-methionine transport system ATP-binding protein